MKTRIIYIICFLLLCVSCKVEQQLGNAGLSGTGNNECCTVRISMPDNWKIVNAQLKTNQLHLEFDRGRGIEKQSFEVSSLVDDLDESTQFRGANRLDGLALLHFTKEDPQIVFNPPVTKSGIFKGLKTREVYAIFRTGTWLIVDFSIENTDLGNLLSHNLQQQYYGNAIDQLGMGTFKLVDSVLHFEFGENNNEKRSFPIHDLVEPHEELGKHGLGAGFGESLRWTGHIKMVSKQKKDQ